jgi:hypothetical protein
MDCLKIPALEGAGLSSLRRMEHDNLLRNVEKKLFGVT